MPSCVDKDKSLLHQGTVFNPGVTIGLYTPKEI
jgi:hypothetical protein